MNKALGEEIQREATMMARRSNEGELMAAKPANQLRQIYDVRGGAIDIKITTETGLSVEEMKAFGGVIEAVEAYVRACPPDSPQSSH